MESNQDTNHYQDKPRRSKKTLIIIIIILIILLLGLILSVYFVQRRTRIVGRAYSETSTSIPELSNSYIFASPLKAKADGQERIRITVFILDSQGKGVGGKEVIFGQSSQITIEAIQKTTDDVGRAIFDSYSQTPGIYILEASVEGLVLPQKVSLNFE